MSKFKKIVITVMSVVIAVVVLLNLVARTGNNIFANTANIILTPFQTAVTTVTKPVKNIFTFFADAKDYKSENEKLKSELETLKKENRNSEELKKENTRLKKILQLTDEMANSKTVPAKVIAFEPSNWFHTLVINKGSMQGVKVSDVVITESGLVGRITETGLNWSRVSTLLDPGNAVGVKLTRTGDVGVAEGDAEILKNQRFKLDYISKETSVINGDLLETSGLGGIYPPGISVGSIEEIQLDNTGELAKATIKPSVDFNEVYEVVVVTYWETAVYDREEVEVEFSAEETEDETDEDEEIIMPEYTKKPESTRKPEKTEKPEVTEKPEKTENPEKTDKPEKTVNPADEDNSDGDNEFSETSIEEESEREYEEQGEEL